MDQPTEEQWLPVIGYEGLYEVSDLGRVRSLYTRTRGRILKPTFASGYPLVNLYKSRATPRSIHSLVTEAFLGPRPEHMEVRHLNGDPTDARLANLRYGTAAENAQDKLQHGRDYNANKTHCKWGHEFTPENTRSFPSYPNARWCVECARKRGREFMRQKRAAERT